MKGHRITYSASELAWLEANHLLPISDYHRAWCAFTGRIDVAAVNLHALRKRKGWNTGRSGQFEKGQAPANKGKLCPAGTGGRHPNARATQFKKGDRSGVAARQYKPIGTERMAKDGYLQRKIHNGLPMQSRWRFVHLINWEAVHGPVPAGYALKCLDGNRLNTDQANWEAVPRGVLARLNGGRFKARIGYDAAPDELKPTLMAVAKLQHAATTRRRDNA
jgi:hypothetical protein